MSAECIATARVQAVGRWRPHRRKKTVEMGRETPDASEEGWSKGGMRVVVTEGEQWGGRPDTPLQGCGGGSGTSYFCTAITRGRAAVPTSRSLLPHRQTPDSVVEANYC